jgi:PKD repeat protein
MARIVLFAALAILAAAILAGCSEPEAPIARFGANDTTDLPPMKVQFADLSQGEIETWGWDFESDGVIDSTLQDPEYEFAEPGNYTVSLTVTGPGGTATTAKHHYVKVVPCTPIADFVADPVEMAGRHPIRFLDRSTCDVISWEWDFTSDGIIESTEQNPEFTYRRNGKYTVTLTVTTPYREDTVTKVDYVTVTGCPT